MDIFKKLQLYLAFKRVMEGVKELVFKQWKIKPNPDSNTTWRDDVFNQPTSSNPTANTTKKQ